MASCSLCCRSPHATPTVATRCTRPDRGGGLVNGVGSHGVGSTRKFMAGGVPAGLALCEAAMRRLTAGCSCHMVRGRGGIDLHPVCWRGDGAGRGCRSIESASRACDRQREKLTAGRRPPDPSLPLLGASGHGRPVFTLLPVPPAPSNYTQSQSSPSNRAHPTCHE